MNCQDQHLNFVFCIKTLTLDVIHAQGSITVRGPKQWEIRLKKTIPTDTQGHSCADPGLTSNVVGKIFFLKCERGSCYLLFWSYYHFQRVYFFYFSLQAQLSGLAFWISSSIISLVTLAGRKLEAIFPPTGRKTHVQLTNCRLTFIWYKC